MIPGKFGDDISNGSGVIVFRDRQTDRQTTQTDTTENNTTLAVRVIMTMITMMMMMMMKTNKQTISDLFVQRQTPLPPYWTFLSTSKNINIYTVLYVLVRTHHIHVIVNIKPSSSSVLNTSAKHR